MDEHPNRHRIIVRLAAATAPRAGASSPRRAASAAAVSWGAMQSVFGARQHVILATASDYPLTPSDALLADALETLAPLGFLAALGRAQALAQG